MKTLEEITAEWTKQQPSKSLQVDQIHKKFHQLGAKGLITITVLVITAMILLLFLYLTYNSNGQLLFNTGLIMMIGALVLRIVFELYAVMRRKFIEENLSINAYFQKVREYHKFMLALHQWWTPFILVVYWIGFVMLIPTFKIHLSSFWFQYVCYSSIPIAAVMIGLIARQIRKEKALLNQIIEDLSGV